MNEQFLKLIFEYLDYGYYVDIVKISKAKKVVDIDDILYNINGESVDMDVVLKEMSLYFGLKESTSISCLEAWFIRLSLVYGKMHQTIHEFNEDDAMNNVKSIMDWVRVNGPNSYRKKIVYADQSSMRYNRNNSWLF